MQDNPQILTDFANYKKTIQGRSPKTVEQYCIDLMLFFKYLKAKKKDLPLAGDAFDNMSISDINLDFVTKVTREDVYDFFYFASTERSNSACTRARKLSAIKSFYKYLVLNRKALETNPAIDVDTPSVKKALPKFLSLEESLLLLNTVENDTYSTYRIRDYAILTLFLNCGMRLSELCGINLNDIDREMRSLRVTGKGAKQRIIYLNDACRKALAEWLDERSHMTVKNKNALFISRLGNRISNKTVQWTVYKYLDMAGLGNRNLSTHKLRHTAATLMYQEGGVDVRVLKDILGHEQLNTTQIYTHVSNTQMEHAMESNPLSRVEAKPRPKIDENTFSQDETNEDDDESNSDSEATKNN